MHGGFEVVDSDGQWSCKTYQEAGLKGYEPNPAHVTVNDKSHCVCYVLDAAQSFDSATLETSNAFIRKIVGVTGAKPLIILTQADKYL